MKNIQTQAELVQFLDNLEERLEKLGNRLSELSFEKFVDKQPKPEMAELDKQRAAIMLDPALKELVDSWLPKADDNLLARRLQAWSDSLLSAQVSARDDIMQLTRSVGDRIISHRYAVGDERVDLGTLRGIIRSNPDRELRKTAWLAYSELSQDLAEDMLALVKLRNQAAQAAGYATYVDMLLELNGMQTAEVEAILHELTEATEGKYQSIITAGAAKFGIEEVQPWDIQYVLEQAGDVPNQYFPKEKILPALYDWAKLMNIDLQELGISHHTLDIPYNGLCMGLNRRDIRILGNPTDGYAYYRTAFHEVGHGLHSVLKEVDSMVLRRESGIFTEGLAEVFGYIAQHPDWLAHMGLNEKEAEQALQGSIGPQFHYLRQRTSFCLFEYEMYKNPDQDLDELFARTEASILGGALDKTRRWAANAWYVNYPVYWQNYVLADVIASQVHHHLEAEIGSLYNCPAAFEFVRSQYIAQGGLVPWLEKIEKATGKPLAAAALIEDMNR